MAFTGDESPGYKMNHPLCGFNWRTAWDIFTYAANNVCFTNVGIANARSLRSFILDTTL